MAIRGQGLNQKCSEVLDHEGRWITYAEQALSLLNHEVMWQRIVETCKILKYPTYRRCTETTLKHCLICHLLFGFQIYSESKKTECISSLKKPEPDDNLR